MESESFSSSKLKQSICLSNWRPSTSHIDVLASALAGRCGSVDAISCRTLHCLLCSNVDCLPTCGLCPPLVRTLSVCRKIKVGQFTVCCPPLPERGARVGSALPVCLSGGTSVVCTNTLVCTSVLCPPTLVPPLPEAPNRLPTRSAETYPVSPGDN